MEGYYCVYHDKQNVGQVQVIRTGLYYRFICRVKLQSDIFLRLYAVCSQHTIDLGLCLPEQDSLVLSVNRPIKYFTGNEYSFLLEKKCCKQNILISENEPFLHLKDLKYARFSILGGKPVVSFKDE